MEISKYSMVIAEGDRSWLRYCGFLDLSLDEFMAVQQALLLRQLNDIASSPVGKKLLGNTIPTSVSQFRESVPLTTYNDYLPELEKGNEDSLPCKPHVWAHTSGTSGFNRIPYTLPFYEQLLETLMAVFILSCSKKRGQTSLIKNDRVLFNVAPSPYMSGILAHGAAERFNLHPVIPPDAHDGMDFKEKIAKGFNVSLQTGVDILIALTSVLVKMGNDFDNHSRNGNGNGNGKASRYLAHPQVLYRYGKALVQSKLEKRSILPKDLWPVKAVISWGIDTNIYRNLVFKYWGKYPYEFHACTEAGIMAMQSWNKRDLTFIAHSNFFEFIPESEWLKNKRDSSYQPHTVLLSEVKAGERYELVITSFYKMPFIRYRLGHLVKITMLEDTEAQIRLPQMVFEGRADDLIDIAGFTRISEKTITQAIANSSINCDEWLARKEVKRGKPVLHIYLELNGNHQPDEVASVMDEQLKNVDGFYRDLSLMLDIHPLEVTFLRPGTFRDYYEDKKQTGAELHQRKPLRMNTSDEVLSKLLALARKQVISSN